MPRFFFDITDGTSTLDGEGLEFPGAHAACDAALATLPDIARDELRSGPSREVSVVMRDESGRAIFTASLTLQARWLVENAS